MSLLGAGVVPLTLHPRQCGCHGKSKRRPAIVSGMTSAGAALPVGATRLRRVSPNKPTMRNRTFRCPDVLWDEANEKAAERQENLSDVIREALERYVKRK